MANNGAEYAEQRRNALNNLEEIAKTHATKGEQRRDIANKREESQTNERNHETTREHRKPIHKKVLYAFLVCLFHFREHFVEYRFPGSFKHPDPKCTKFQA